MSASKVAPLTLVVPVFHNGVGVPVSVGVEFSLKDATVLGLEVPDHIKLRIYTMIADKLKEAFARED